MGPFKLDQSEGQKSAFSTAFEGISKLIEQHPDSVAQLFKKHRIGHNGSIPPTKKNVGNAIKVKPDFFASLLSAIGKTDSFTGYSNLTGDQDRITLGDKLANAGLVFSNIIRDTQRKPEPYEKRLPSYYDTTGEYNIRATQNGLNTSSTNKSTRLWGMDKKAVWIIGGLVVLALLYELSKRK